MQMARRRCFTDKLGHGYRGGSRIIRGEKYILYSVNSVAISAALIQHFKHYEFLRSQIYPYVGKFNLHWLRVQTVK